ncbi:MAG: helix-turn-helix domain-containing protein, partial [Chloroflexota bacterium]|nr:helix-turn-helix domain-containing protein [Chloroflexota bacterium]
MKGPAGTTVEEHGDWFGARLRRARESAGLSQEELAERAGLSPNAVGGLERGEHRRPYPATIRALAAALGMSDAEYATLVAAVPPRNQPIAQTNVAPPGLPSPLFPLVGREREVADVCALLRREDVRLVTLTGPGGVGKTRLALQVAVDLASDFGHGAAFVSLAAVRDPALVGPAIAQVLGVVDSGGRAPVDRLGDALRGRHVLLILDNYEQVISAAPLVTDLLARCPRLEVLVTSRAGLRLDGERVFPVPPLEVPDPERRLIAEQMIDIAAVRLFVDRAQDADPAFTLTDGNAGAVAAVCQRLDGLPLAIELAAARSTLLAPDAMLPRLARRLPLLTSGRRDAPDRHQTMRHAIAWSHD